MRNVSQTNLKVLLLPVPPLREQQQIAATLSSIDERLSEQKSTVKGLEALKVALMSVLLTGEVRVTPDEAAA